mmetsp:Transcript_79906/g.120092  ORF Transcript_79906/g.120092 Transcript_79906/m.120092 type:complete len:269 (+) Transcript_79906:477-1283(+)
MNLMVNTFRSQSNEPFVNEFDTIPGQIEANLLQSQTVRHDDQSLWTFDLHFKFLISLRQHGLHRLQHVKEQIGGSHIHLQLLRRRSMHIQHISKQIVHKAQGILNDTHIFPRLRALSFRRERFLFVDGRFNETTRRHGRRDGISHFVSDKVIQFSFRLGGLAGIVENQGCLFGVRRGPDFIEVFHPGRVGPYKHGQGDTGQEYNDTSEDDKDIVGFECPLQGMNENGPFLVGSKDVALKGKSVDLTNFVQRRLRQKRQLALRLQPCSS